ncbi:membrane protein insertion efficiency factor YidD [Kitasatospora sp. NPDC052868]|uniref:membrane protein insertion efficiency factor YidD n=1 Tax=Kitasatospora sp. NPDC052868 TaxID=3364060 RepID=UPI0037CC4382
MSYPPPGQGASYPPQRPQRAWWWLPEQERRRRREQRRAWAEHQRRNGKRKRDNDCSDACDCCDLGDPCLIALIPVMMASGVRFALGAGRSRANGSGHGRGRGSSNGHRRGADPAAPVPGGFAAGVLYGAVRYYRAEVSPKRPACCPYTPTCSTYAVQALHRHGALRGARLTVGRLLRCRPGAARRGGVDQVPE